MQEPQTGPPTANPPASFTDGQLEALKWIALASMFTDHIGRHLLGIGEQTWVFAAGRLAFPLFAFVLAANLARPGDQPRRCVRVAVRLALWCAVSQLPAAAARGEPYLLNVFGTLALGAGMSWVLQAPLHIAWRVLATIAVALAGNHFEFDIFGIFLVPALFAALASQRRDAMAVAAAALVGVAALNGLFGGAWGWAGTLLAVPLAAAVRAVPVNVPRLRWLFYAIYPLHLAVIGVLKRL